MSKSISSYMVIFNLYDSTRDRKEYYAVDTTSIHKIRPLESITRVPNTLPCIVGITNYRGKVIPVINMKTLLEFPNTEIRDSRLLIAEIKGKLLGLLVDGIEQVSEISLEDMDVTSSILDNSPYLRGVVKQDDKLVLVIDIERLISSAIGVKDDDAEQREC
ncbi:MAG: chemotaxis protein CheW [Candidatus Nitrosocaldaceae archaeon]